MKEKNTEELENILGKTHINEFSSYCDNNKESILSEENSFYVYIKEIMSRNKLSQQNVFLKADIPERYGYKLLSGEKHTKQRDVILRICYAAELSLEETQRALEKYGMAKLYAKIPRDAFIMIAFNERPGSIIEVNTFMKENKMEPLRTSGVQE
ncbi:MAG: hypothetical protein K6E13_06955 [Lachnospiraceae bacterium]|nr:hypothetical protein [Lachnospiraceae bacterium]